MPDPIRSVFDFMDAGGITMPFLLLTCLALWYCILRTWLDLLPGTVTGCQELTEKFDTLCSGRSKPDEHLAASLSEAIHARLRRRLSFAAVLAGAAPLIGLLGTVTGMMDTFDSVARFGLSNTKALSTGISQAMISTQTGLVVAVPGLIAVYFLRRRAARARLGLEHFGLCLSSGKGNAS